jgi:hypothetical protein
MKTLPRYDKKAAEAELVAAIANYKAAYRLEPTLVYCNGCGKDILNIDGCPDCGTTRYLTHDRNQ